MSHRSSILRSWGSQPKGKPTALAAWHTRWEPKDSPELVRWRFFINYLNIGSDSNTIYTRQTDDPTPEGMQARQETYRAREGCGWRSSNEEIKRGRNVMRKKNV